MRGRRSAARQRGAALLTAMIIVTLVATLAASMVWQQWRAVQIESAERARAQASWILAGALDFALLILREDQRSRDQRTRLTEPWATPLAESRLSTFLSADNAADAGDDGPAAFLSGTIADAQAKFNLSNLTTGSDDIKAGHLKTLRTLCQSVGVDESVAAAIASGLARVDAGEATASSDGATPAPLRPTRMAELTWLGVSPDSIRKLEPFATILPVVTAINLNTAPKEVLAAATGADLGSIERVLQIRQRTPFQNSDDFYKQLNITAANVTSPVDALRSSYFEVSGRLRLADHVVTQHSLVQRIEAPPYRTILRRELVSTIEEAGR